LTDDEISVLCDIGSDGVTRPERLHLVAILTDRGFIATIPAGHSQRLKLTPHAERVLGELGIGLNES
jgi:hypothetical protein